MALRIGGAAQPRERMPELHHRPDQRQAVAVVARLIGVPADDERFGQAASRARSNTPASVARSRIWWADKCGIAWNPSACNRMAQSSVASIPFAGDAVTDTRAPAGRCGT